MRLTLRTLLAYLDDTLEPLEIKTIGQKVSESDTAQELIARIKQVTRRRRITTPPATGPNSFDPNVVAEYLDNGLTGDQIAELEKICLESDVHLAEVASCHQILTLVLGEPAVVPPTAKQRMYGLVRGREAIPFRRAAAASGEAAAHASTDTDADEMYLLGLPFYRRGSWLRWALPVAAVVLFTVVAVALWQSIQPGTPVAQKSSERNPDKQRNEEVDGNSGKGAAQPAGNGANAENKNASAKQSETANKSPDERQGKIAETKDIARSEPKSGTQSELKTENPSPNKQPGNTATATASGRQAPPSTARVEVGQYHIPDYPPGHSLLVQRKDEKTGWSRLAPGARVSTGDQLVSLPGYASEVRLDCGIHLLLRGNLPEFVPPEVVEILYTLQDSAVVLHKPRDTAADLTLQRGRLFLSNHKGNETPPLVVRLRFEDKVWDLTLHSQAEMIVDLIKKRRGGEQVAELSLNLLQGNAGIVLEGEVYPEMAVPGLAGFSWNSLDLSKFVSRQLTKEDVEFGSRIIFFKKPALNTDAAKNMDLALKAIKDRMIVDKAPLTVLQEVLYNTEKYYEHQLALFCLAALDEVKEIFNVMGTADQIHSPDRRTAIFALYRWLDHGREQQQKLFDPQTQNGLLVSAMGYTRGEAKRIMELLQNPTDDQFLSSKEYYEEMAQDLSSEKVAIAEMACWRLSMLAIGMCKLDMPKLKAFNAARPSSERSAAKQEVLDKINEGRLPPPDPNKPRAPGVKIANPNK